MSMVADSYITKPFHSKVLLARIENLLKRRGVSSLKNLLIRVLRMLRRRFPELIWKIRDKQFLKQLQAIIQKNLSDSEFGVEDVGTADRLKPCAALS